MGFIYYYAPCFVGSPPGITDPNTGDTYAPDPVRQPGQDTGAGPEFVSGHPPGMSVLKYDDINTRCVVRLQQSFSLPGWVLKTTAEVLADYPGLSGVI